jgi:predicted ATP-grasp superfamily ATP-dependent carboligase
MVALFARQRVRMWPFDFGNSSCTRSVPAQEVNEGVLMVERLLRGLEYRGIFSAEFKVDQRTGRFNVLEVNTRPWWYVEFAATCGVDVCHLAYRDALGLPLDPVPEYATGRRCLYLPSDWPACISLYNAGQLTLPDWIRSWVPVGTLVHSWDDPLPGMSNLANLTAATVSRQLRRNRTARKPRLPSVTLPTGDRHAP